MGTNVAGAWDRAAKLLHESSTKQPSSAEAQAALISVQHLVYHVCELPPAPKAVWKKLVQELKVPLQLGVAFTAAAQHNFESPVTVAALVTLGSLISAANEAGVTNSGGGGSLGSSIRQQLEQSGMLKQLATVMTAVAADLRDETAACAAAAWGKVQSTLRWYELMQEAMHVHDVMMYLWGPKALDVDAVAWLCHPSGHAEAGLQLAAAALQHASAMAQHLLPDLRQVVPEEAEEFLGHLQTATRTARALCMRILVRTLQVLMRWQQQGQGSDGMGLQRLLLSPQTPPCIAAMLVLLSADVSNAVAAHSGRAGSSSSSGCGISSMVGPTGLQQYAPGDNSSSSSSSGENRDNLSSCQMQLLQLLSLAPELTTWVEEPVQLPAVCTELRMALGACSAWCHAVLHPASGSGMAPWQLQLQQQQQQQQRGFQAEQLATVLLLLPTVLLPCASTLLSPSAQQLMRQQPQQWQRTLEQLLDLSNNLLVVGTHLNMQQQHIGWRSPQPPVSWMQDVLGVVLQVVDQLVCQQQHPTAGTTVGSSSNDNGQGSMAASSATCLARLLPLLCNLLCYPHSQLCQPSSSSNDNISSSRDHATASAAPEATMFVKLGPAIEAVVRFVTPAVQSGMLSTSDLPILRSAETFTDLLLSRDGVTDSVLVQHMGLCGPVVLAQEQRQLYSLLCTVLKVGRRGSAAAKACWGERAAGSCCLAAGQAAVRLLSPPPTGSAAAQQPAADYLPSLVIFGRCCLQWAEQLQQQAPELLLLWSGALGAAQGEALLQEGSAALLCIRCSQGVLAQGVVVPGVMIETSVLAVSAWVGGLELPAVLAQLEAAACAPQQLQQQLRALLSAQQGAQQGLTDASLAALVRQLQATGFMLCNIAVPHFCNNTACGNINRSTEVQLVSGRSCICAGCRTARYCGRDCQRAAWKQHKPVCQALAAVVGTPAGS